MSSSSAEQVKDAAEHAVVSEHQSFMQIVVRRFLRHRLAMVGSIIIALLVLVAVFAPYVAPYGYRDHHYDSVLHSPSLRFPLGTDNVGACILSRIIYASRISLSVGFLSMFIAMSLGTAVGATAGFFGGRIDNVLMRVVDVALCIPALFLLLMIVAIVSPSTTIVVVAIGVTNWMVPSRIVRGQVLSLKEQDFVEAARATGAGTPLIIMRHILPNAMGPLIVNSTLMVGQAIITESTLSFLGVGIQPPTPSLGNMLTAAQTYLWMAPWMAVFPGLMILVLVLAFNLMGDGLRDALDPKLKE